MIGDEVVAVNLVVDEVVVVGADVDVSGNSTCMQSFKRWQIISFFLNKWNNPIDSG